MSETDRHFIGLIYSMSQAALHQLGKIVNPLTGKVEKNLNEAKMTIDMIDMLKEKTKGNLSKEEETFLNNTLATLQLNYADEIKKGSIQQNKVSTSEEKPKN